MKLTEGPGKNFEELSKTIGEIDPSLRILRQVQHIHQNSPATILLNDLVGTAENDLISIIDLCQQEKSRTLNSLEPTSETPQDITNEILKRIVFVCAKCPEKIFCETQEERSVA